MEILAPAGNEKSLIQAVKNGADAVYLGVASYNARNNIDNFTLENLSEAVAFAHLNNVKVYLTLNILFDDEELQGALDVVFYATKAKVDAFIVQDLGLVRLIKKYYPDVVIHASTQMAIHNAEGAKLAKELGFSRVVLAREVELSEIRKIKDEVDIEIEYFCQGALCVCFSGNCYLCSYATNNSGNRGKCQQFCRLPFSLYKADKLIKKGNLLSTKDICMLNRLKEMEEAGVCTLKIEGRARRPFYVASATKVYKKAKNNNYNVNKEDFSLLKLAFNRGDYCEGYFNGNDNIISNIQGHKGVYIGEVVSFESGKNFNKITMKLNHKLNSGDGLKFFRGENEVTSIGAYDITCNGGCYTVTSKANVKVGDRVHLTLDSVREESLNYDTNLIPLDFDVNMQEGAPILVKVRAKNEEVVYSGEVCESAINMPLTYNSCYESFNKLKESNFYLNNFSFNCGNVFLAKSKLNEVRRECVKLITERLLDRYNNENNIALLTERKNIENEENNTKSVKKLEKIKIFSDFNEISDIFDNLDEYKLIYDCYDFSEENLSRFALMKGEKYLNLPNYATSKDVRFFEEIIKKYKFNIVANNLYALNFDTKIIAGSLLNIYNSQAVKYLQSRGIEIFFVAELDDGKIEKLKKKCGSNNIFKGKKIYMTLRHCPLKNNGVCSCSSCKYSDGYYYVMDNKMKLNLKRKKVTSCTFYLE